MDTTYLSGHFVRHRDAVEAPVRKDAIVIVADDERGDETKVLMLEKIV